MTTVTTRPTKPPNLMHYYPHLSAKDKALILRAYNEWNWRGQNEQAQAREIHLGLLPFISMQKIGAALVWMAADANQYRRVWAGLCGKVEAARWASDRDYPAYQTWELVLHNASVHKHFGGRPDLGVTIPMIPKEKCRGPLKWNIGAKEWQPEKIQAAPRITLTKLNDKNLRHNRPGMGRWLLHAPTRYKELCLQWVLDHCY